MTQPEFIDRDLIAGLKLPLMELFYSIQGEGFNTGEAAVFVRIGGCDVGCKWCDVKESWDPLVHPSTATEEIIKEINKSKEKIALIVETVERLQRSFKESVMLDELRKQAKVELHFIRENLIIHQNSNSSEIQRWDLAVFVAKSYVLQISDNVKRTFEQKIRKGEVIGKAPIGYLNITKIDNTKDVILDPDRAHLVRKIFELYATGKYSMQTVAEILAKDGLRSNTPQKNVLKLRQIECILKNPFYYGYQLCKGQIHQHKYETIIDKNLFDQCTVTRAKNLNGKKKLLGNPFIFKGLVNCERCGCAVTPEFKKGKYVYLFDCFIRSKQKVKS